MTSKLSRCISSVFKSLKVITFTTAFIFLASNIHAQTNLWIYTDHLVNGFQDWSWAPRNLENTSPVYSGSNSISVSAALYEAVAFHFQADFDTVIDIHTANYADFSFWANGGTSGGQVLQVYVSLNDVDQSGYQCAPLTTNWQKITIPLSSLNAVNQTNLSTVTIKLNGGSTGTFYLDQMGFDPISPVSLSHLGVNASQTIRQADQRWAGVNTATWDGSLSSSQTIPLLQQIGIRALRWPGGSTSDDYYHWASDISGNNTFQHVATNIGAQVFTTVNYGSGTSNEAAGWVLFANITNHCGFKYWEIGNECYGPWEVDNNSPAHDPATYAARAKNYAALMKAADPADDIKIGVVVVPGEDTFVNNYNNYAVNPRTGTTNYGWTPVMLSQMKNLGFTPDFAIYHFYPQYTATNWEPDSTDSDPLLLQVAANWAHDAANLRQQLTDYLGSAATNVELVCTENNSDSGAMGRQSSSIVNALYLADSAGQLMQTEFNAYLWWDLRNGEDTQGDFDPTLYGWRTYGDYGLLNGPGAPYPTFYAEKLLQYFVRPGDTILRATSDNLLLSAYSARKADGSLAMLVINKTPTNVLDAQIALTNFTPASVATVRSYGVAQDNATENNNNSPGAQDIATNTLVCGTVFTNSFPAYTLTLLTFPPAPSKLQFVSHSTTQCVLQLQGQSGVPYVIQSRTNLSSGSWVSIATNTLVGTYALVTNSISAGNNPTFWRAVWMP